MTTSLEARCLESFPAWLGGLAQDARLLTELLVGEGPEAVRRLAAVSLLYWLRSLDHVDPGFEDLGLFEDACVLRALAAGLSADECAADATGSLARFASDAALISQFLGEEAAPQLVRYVVSLENGGVLGDSVAQALENPEARQALVEAVLSWADAYQPPAPFRDAKDLLKLRAFLVTRLGAVNPARSVE